MKRLTKGTLASTYEIAAKVNEIVDWINGSPKLNKSDTNNDIINTKENNE